MRVQLQQGSAETRGIPKQAPETRGVTVDQMRAAMNELFLEVAAGSVPWFPNDLESWLFQSIRTISVKMTSIPANGGVVQVGTISTLKQETFFRNKEYRIEIENLRGRNLRR